MLWVGESALQLRFHAAKKQNGKFENCVVHNVLGGRHGGPVQLLQCVSPSPGKCLTLQTKVPVSSTLPTIQFTSLSTICMPII